MSDLSPRAREILRSGRDLNRPTDADRARLEHALRERLGATVMLTETSPTAPAARPRWPFVTGGVVGASLVGGALLLASQRAPTVAMSPRSVITANAAASTMPAPAASIEASAESASPPKPVAPSAAPPNSVRSPAPDSLAQEVALLARATASLHAGRPTESLKILDEHQRRFPKAMLGEERRAARAQALCSLGRLGEAQAELARLAPQSLAAARARQVCDARAASGK